MYIGNSPTSQAFVTDYFNGDGTTVAYTMTVAPANTSSMLVSVSGVLQSPNTYSINATTLTFSAAPPSGTGNISVRYLGIPATGVTTTAYRTVTEFTATASQTTFTPPTYTVGYINVYRNGSLLGSADYTATNGTTVVLAVGATVGDLVVVESFYVSSVLNAIPATAGAVNSTYIANGAVGSAQIAAGAVGTTQIATGAVTQTLLGTGVAGNGPAFSAYASSSQTISSATWTKILFDTEDFDTNSNFASSRFTPTIAGYYQVSSNCEWATNSGTTGVGAFAIYKNGSPYKRGNQFQLAAVNNTGYQISLVVYLNGSTDYVEIYMYQGSGGNLTTQNSDNGNAVWFTGAMVRSA